MQFYQKCLRSFENQFHANGLVSKLNSALPNMRIKVVQKSQEAINRVSISSKHQENS